MTRIPATLLIPCTPLRAPVPAHLALVRSSTRPFSASSSPRASAPPSELAFPTKPNPSPFEIFHLDPQAPIEAKSLKARFYKLSRLYHPDLRRASGTSSSSTGASSATADKKGKGKAVEEDGSSEFRQIVEAYEILRDERKRAVYLRSGRGGPQSRNGWNDPGYNFTRGRPMRNGFDRGAYPSASWDWAGDPYNPHFRAGASSTANPSAPGWSSSGMIAKNSTVFLLLLTASALLSPLTFWSTMPESMLVAADTGNGGEEGAISGSYGADKRHWAAVRNLERARREAKDGGLAKREAIRKRVREIERERERQRMMRRGDELASGGATTSHEGQRALPPPPPSQPPPTQAAS